MRDFCLGIFVRLFALIVSTGGCGLLLLLAPPALALMILALWVRLVWAALFRNLQVAP